MWNRKVRNFGKRETGFPGACAENSPLRQGVCPCGGSCMNNWVMVTLTARGSLARIAAELESGRSEKDSEKTAPRRRR